MERLLRKNPRKSDECPTCRARAVEVSPGIIEWAPSAYFYRGKDQLCSCEAQRALFRHYLLAHIPDEYMRLSVDDDYFGDPVALEETRKYLNNWENNRIHGLGLGFYSKRQGTGKTFLATYVGRELIKRGESVFYIPFLSIVNTYELSRDERRDEEERLRNSTVLILDEIVKSVSAAQHDLFGGKFEELIRHRSNYNRVTILTTNIEPDELDHHYPRTYSLLKGKETHIKLDGIDVRREAIWDINTELAENGEIREIR